MATPLRDASGGSEASELLIDCLNNGVDFGGEDEGREGERKGGR